MSRLSGKCDLYDHISGLGGWFNKEGKPVKFGDERVKCYYSDLYLDFIEFKKKTGGVLHQHKCIKEIDEYNQDFIKEHCPQFEIIRHEEKVPDTRKKSGYREKITYTYKYWGKEYTAKELKKKGGVYIVVDIHFKTLLDLIPYLPYIVVMSAYSDGKQTVFISNESYVEEEANDSLQFGHERNTYHYRHALSELYKKVVLAYFNPTGREFIEEVTFDENGIGKVSNPIDTNFDVEWGWPDNKIHNHWTSPEVIDEDAGTIKIHEFDLETFGNKMLVYYVKKVPHEVNIEFKR